MPIVSFNLSREVSPLTKKLLTQGENGFIRHTPRDGVTGHSEITQFLSTPSFQIVSEKMKNGQPTVIQVATDYGNRHIKYVTRKPKSSGGFHSFVEKHIEKGQEICNRVLKSRSGEYNAQIFVEENGKMVAKKFSTNPKTPDVIKAPKDTFEFVLNSGDGGMINAYSQSEFKRLAKGQ